MVWNIHLTVDEIVNTTPRPPTDAHGKICNELQQLQQQLFSRCKHSSHPPMPHDDSPAFQTNSPNHATNSSSSSSSSSFVLQAQRPSTHTSVPHGDTNSPNYATNYSSSSSSSFLRAASTTAIHPPIHAARQFAGISNKQPQSSTTPRPAEHKTKKEDTPISLTTKTGHKGTHVSG